MLVWHIWRDTMEFFFKAVILIFSGILILRVAGRKSISQMTISQTIIMISIGTLIVQPIANRSVWRAVLAAAIFVASSLLLDYLIMKFDVVEKFITGRSKIVINNGQLVPENLRKMKITVDQLEMRLRQSGISKISDVKTATIEPNGQLGYELTDDAKPLTVGQFRSMLKGIDMSILNASNNTQQVKPIIQANDENLFTEVKNNQHQSQIPDQLH